MHARASRVVNQRKMLWYIYEFPRPAQSQEERGTSS
jgi:hypothetical protein